jgi:hypothetical protein
MLGFIGLAFVCIGALVTGVGLFSFANIFGLVSKDERYQSHGTDQRVQRNNIWILLIGFALFAIGFNMMFAAGA